MNWEQLSAFGSIAALAVQFFILWKISNLKIWCLQTFVTKGDFMETLHLWSKGNSRPQGSHE